MKNENNTYYLNIKDLVDKLTVEKIKEVLKQQRELKNGQ
jgi:hypothetical protein